MATHSSILAWRIPWTEKPDGLQSMGPQKSLSNWACLDTDMHTGRWPCEGWSYVATSQETTRSQDRSLAGILPRVSSGSRALSTPWSQTSSLQNCEAMHFCSLNWLVCHLGSPRASLVAQTVKNLPAMQEAWVWSLGWEDSLEEGMATHPSIFSWRISMDRGVWRATVHGVAKSRTWLSD